MTAVQSANLEPGETLSCRLSILEGARAGDPARLALQDLHALGLMPGDFILVAGSLVIPALPGKDVDQGTVALPTGSTLGLQEGAILTVSAAPENAAASTSSEGTSDIRFADIGGLGPELGRLREMVELPLMRPDLFAHLGITPPRGVLMSGPPGCGKTLIARALAAETKAAFFHIAGPEVADKHFGASEARIREVFEAASAAAPAIIFVDEIDSIAPARENLSGDKQAERRMVAQLLTLMDGLETRGDVIVLAATNLPDLMDPALRRPGRFDREIVLSAPDVKGRADILRIHTRSMPLAADVDVDALAARTHGFVGADLASLAREAAMATLRRSGDGPLAQLEVSQADFAAALSDVRPSALRAVEVEVPQTRWEDVAGAQEAKQALQQAVEWPIRYADHFKALGLKAPSGILLHGPPGTGKTLLGRALAHAAEANFIAVNAGELLSMYLGESERAIRSVFARARASAPTVLFFDELDALAPRRDASLSETTGRVVAQLLTEMDGLSQQSGIFILGATNRMDQIDPAILRPGRFDLKIAVDLPSQDDRLALLDLHLGDTQRAELDFAALAARCEGFSGADVAELVRAARQACLARSLGANSAADPKDLRVTSADFTVAMAVKSQTP